MLNALVGAETSIFLGFLHEKQTINLFLKICKQFRDNFLTVQRYLLCRQKLH